MLAPLSFRRRNGKESQCESGRDLYGGRLPLKSDITEKILIKPKRKKRLSHPGEEHTKEYGNEKRLQLSAEAGLGRTRNTLGKRKRKEKARCLGGPGKCYLRGRLAPRRRVLCEARRPRQRTSSHLECPRGPGQVTETPGDFRNLGDSCWAFFPLQGGVGLGGGTACEITRACLSSL